MHGHSADSSGRRAFQRDLRFAGLQLNLVRQLLCQHPHDSADRGLPSDLAVGLQPVGFLDRDRSVVAIHDVLGIFGTVILPGQSGEPVLSV